MNTPRTWEKQLKETLIEQVKVAYRMLKVMDVSSEEMAVAVLLPNLHIAMHETSCTIEDEAVRRTKSDTLQEVMDWAIGNGITDKKSFCALRDYLHGEIALFNDN